MGDLRWISCQDRKGQPPQSRDATCEVVANWGGWKGISVWLAYRSFPGTLFWCAEFTGCMPTFSVCFPYSASTLPTPTFPSVFLFFYHPMQFPLLHGRAYHTSEETTASCSFTHISRQTVLCRRDISVLAMPMPKCFSRF